MSTVRTSTLLYRPSLSIWTARRKDKSESLKVNKAAGAIDGAANVNKQLLPDNAELLAIQKWATGFRTWVYDTTLPWDDTGWRIGRVERHMDFMAEIGDRLSFGDGLVEAFVNKYDAAVEDARFKLNTMFDQSDYPVAGAIRRRFNFSIDCSVLPNAEDFRVVDGVTHAEADRLVANAQRDVESRIEVAMAEAHNRLYEVVAKMANTLQQYGDKTIKKFNDSLVGNIADLVKIMPALNLTNDPKLADLARQAQELTQYDMAMLRKDDSVRSAAISEATALAARFKSFIESEEIASAVVVEEAKTTPVDDIDVILVDWES